MGVRFLLGVGNGDKKSESMNLNPGQNSGGSIGRNGGHGGDSGGVANYGGNQGGSGNGDNGGNGGMSNYGGQNGNGGGGGTSNYGGANQGGMTNAYGAGGMADGGNMYRPQDMARRGSANMYAPSMLGMYSPHYDGEEYGDYFPHRMGFTAPIEMVPEARRHRSKRTGRFIRGEDDDDLTMHYGRRRQDEDEEEDHGRYERREREDDGGETESLKKKLKKMEQRLEEAEEGKEKVERLHRKLKEMECKLEEQEGESERGKESGKREGGRSSRKKKERGENDEDDDEDDPWEKLRHMLGEEVSGKEFMKQLPNIFQAICEVIKNPPPTWPAYLEKGDYSGIFAMESKELTKAIEQYKAGQKDVEGVLKEVKHSGAALIQLYASLMHQIDEHNK